MKTFLKWPGNKSKHLKHILPHIPDNFDRYFEPFLGSGAVYLSLKPEKSVLNDCNKDLIDIWNLVKSDYSYIVRYFKQFETHFVDMDVDDKKNLCRKITEGLNSAKASKARSVQMLLMIFCAYMGIIFIKNRYRFQGLEKRIFVDDKYYFFTESYYTRLREISSLLQNTMTMIYNDDFRVVLKFAKKDDFVFLDPPYMYEYDVGFNYNSNERLDVDFMNILLHECEKLDKKKVRWLMTQADTRLVRKTFKRYTIVKYPVYRPIKNEYTNELIIKNY